MAEGLRYAANLIKRRLRSRFEVDKALRQKGVSEEDRQAVLAELTTAGLLDDRRFAKAYVHDRDLLAPRGRYRLVQELKLKGVEAKIIQEVLAERETEASDSGEKRDEQLARELAERYASRYAHLPSEVRRRRLAAMLERRGFAADVAWRILNT